MIELDNCAIFVGESHISRHGLEARELKAEAPVRKPDGEK